MNNLKRVLSLALSGIMLVGMMAVGASAATFSDAEDIKNTDAVNFMVALNIINGNDDGSFAPDRVVTRAEMAKMITVALNGGKDPVLGTLTTPTYSDIKGHWAEKYIEYCSNLGIISGRGDGTFDPGATVTGTEAAKMMLVAMGYNSTIHNFTGADWALNVNTAANDATPNALYKGLESIDPTQGLSRENAAQLIYNGVQDDMMKRSDSLTVDDGKVSYGYEKAKDESILTEKYGYSVSYGFVNDVDYVEDDDTYNVDIVSDRSYNGNGGYTSSSKFNSTIAKTRDDIDNTVTFAEDVSALYGQLVKVVYNGDLEAVGIYAVDSSVLATTVVDKISSDLAATDTTIKVDGTAYRFDGTDKQAKDVPVYELLNGAYKSNTTLATLKANASKEFAIDLIDNDGNGRVNCIVIRPVTVGKVTYLSKTAITISNGIGTQDLEDDINVYEGVKKDDYVIATPAANTVDGKVSIVKAETLTGSVGAARASGNDTARTEIRIDGTWYKVASTTLNGHTVPGINDDVMLVMVNGFYAYAEADKTTSKDLLVVTAVGSSKDFDDAFSAKVAFTDGSTATVDIELEDVADAPENQGLTLTDKDNNNIVGVLFTYEKDGSTYTLTKATADNTGYDDAVATGTFSAKSDKIGNTYVSDDAVVFVLYNAGSGKTANTDYETVTDIKKLTKVEITTGKALKSWNDTYMAGQTETVFAYPVQGGFSDDTNGLDYAKVLVVAFDNKDLPGATGDTKYGYVVAKSYQEKDGSTTWTNFDIWNGDEVVSVKEKKAAKYSAGTAISYKDLGGGEVDTVTPISALGAVTGYNAGDETIKIMSAVGVETTYEIDDDTTILYINSKDSEGVESDGIELANEDEDGGYILNAIYSVKNSHVEAIFVDVNNELDGESHVGVAVTEVAKPGTATAAADIFADKANGVYTFGTGTTNTDVTGLTTTITDFTKLVFFKFTTTEAASTAYTLTIKNGDTTVYTETASVGTAGSHFFYVDKDLQKIAGTAGQGVTSIPTGTALTYTITGTGVNEVGTFTL